ncbi:MAG: flippase-like domain-containing protein [Enterococcus lacertideformus]|uniref:Phosphatidylglycerol lysyltransferase n=1 Tax=Enterococcus lacertideformus TaxID=2771493 RepID=A0A931B037_9ENTE|nr:flippase-like domain-containing protein [Enterococcus lacertideformus]
MVLLKIFPESHLLEENGTIKIGLLISSCLLPLYMVYISARPPISSARWLGLKFTVVSTIDYLTSGIVMYAAFCFLNLSVRFVDMESIFIIATIAGIISMVPGGFGAFDVIFLLGVTQELNVAKEQALMALILYRLAYYIIPLLIGLLLCISEIQVLISQRIGNNQLTILSKELTSVVFSITQEQIKQIGRALSTSLFFVCSLLFLLDSCLLFLDYAYLKDILLLVISPFYTCVSVLLCTDSVVIYNGAIATYKNLRIKVFVVGLCQVVLFFEGMSLTATLLTMALVINLFFLKRWLEVEVIKRSILEKVIWVVTILFVIESLVEVYVMLPDQQLLLMAGSVFFLLFLWGGWEFFQRKKLRKTLKLNFQQLNEEEYQSFL